MNSQSLGLAHMLSNADAVIWFTAITLLVMSIVSWTLIIAKGRVAQRLRRQIAQSAAAFWSAQDLTAGLATLKQREAQPALALMAQAAVEVEQQASGQSLDAQSLRIWFTHADMQKNAAFNFQLRQRNEHFFLICTILYVYTEATYTLNGK